MTTLFGESNNARQSLELLNTSLKTSHVLDGKSCIKTEGVKGVASSVQIHSATGCGEQGVQQQQSVETPIESEDPPYPSFVTDDPANVRVVHVQPDQANIQGAQSQVSPINLTYTVGGQIHQVLQSNDAVASVIDAAGQDSQRYAYYPGVQSSDANGQAGQFYVMMSPQDVIPVGAANTPRIIAPRGNSHLNTSNQLASLNDGTFSVERPDETVSLEFRKVDSPRSSRDERRRATHNEVERRRRDKINTWIMKLAGVVPDCQMDQTKQGTSKGGVLSKALDFIVKLRSQNERLTETIKEQERTLVENQVLRQQVEKLRQENAILQANLQMHQQQAAVAEHSNQHQASLQQNTTLMQQQNQMTMHQQEQNSTEHQTS